MGALHGSKAPRVWAVATLLLVGTLRVRAASTSLPYHYWARSYGGPRAEDAWCIQETADGGFVVTGWTESYGGQYTDGWVLKLRENGSVQWQRSYGRDWEVASYVLPITNGGYLLAGYTQSYGAGALDYWLLKLRDDGTIQWQKAYGGSADDQATSVEETADSGYVMAGETKSFGAGDWDLWVVKLDGEGAIEWEKTYGGPGEDATSAEPIQPTADGGYILTGRTESFGAGGLDVWVLKLDASGAIEWEKTYGGPDDDEARAIKPAPDGGYVVAGYTQSFGAGDWDLWVLKLDDEGRVEWQKTYGGPGEEMTWSVQPTDHGGYVLGGYTGSFGAGNGDGWVLKLREDGSIEWQRAFGAKDSDWLGSIRQVADGGYVVAGGTDSYGGGAEDFWVLRLDREGTIPDCSLMRATNAMVQDTEIAGVDSEAESSDSAAKIAGTRVGAPKTLAWVTTQCSHEDTFGYCGDPATYVHQVQGPGLTSPLDGETGVNLEGVVVGDFQDPAAALGGFFLQEEEADADGEPLTSEGLFVRDAGFGTELDVGDRVRVQGVVAETAGLTELRAITHLSVCSSGSSVAATAVDLPVAAIDNLERYEGMLLTFPEVLYATGTDNLGRYGEVWVSAGGRLFQPTQVIAPGVLAQARQDLNDRSRLLLDDGSQVEYPLTVPYLTADKTLRLGDTVGSLSGVLGFGDGFYRLHPTQPVSFERANGRPTVPAGGGNSLVVGSFHLGGYFNGDGLGGGFPTLGGADTPGEFQRQRDKLLDALLAMDADIVALQGVENDGYGPQSAIQDLVAGLNSAAGAGTYAAVDPGLAQMGAHGVAVGLVYKPAAVALAGPAAILDSAVDPAFLEGKNRPALAQTFAHGDTGEQLTVAVVHLASRDTLCDDVGDPDVGDGQGNCNLTRASAAKALADWLAIDPTGSGDADMLIVGDLNAYAREDPIAALEDASYTDLVDAIQGEGAYSWVSNGQAGALDHGLASATLAAKVVAAAIWHINADEPRVLDYNQEHNPPSLYSPDRYRSAEHDPVLVRIHGMFEVYLPLVVR